MPFYSALAFELQFVTWASAGEIDSIFSNLYLYLLGMDAAICLPFLRSPLPNQAHIPTGVKYNDCSWCISKIWQIMYM